MRRKLTKQEKFDIDLLYRPYLIKRRSRIVESNLYEYEKNLENLPHLKILDLFSKDFSEYFKDRDELYLFLSDYGDLLNWNKVLKEALHTLRMIKCNDDVEFVETFKEYMTDNCWEILTRRFLNNNEFLRKFKNKLDWDFISSHRLFNLNELLEFKDYIDIHHIFGSMEVRGDIRSYFIDYINENFEGIIEYALKKEELSKNGSK